jgi:hypothetical protein
MPTDAPQGRPLSLSAAVRVVQDVVTMQSKEPIDDVAAMASDSIREFCWWGHLGVVSIVLVLTLMRLNAPTDAASILESATNICRKVPRDLFDPFFCSHQLCFFVSFAGR